MTGRMPVALPTALALVGSLALAGCGTGALPGSSTTTKSAACLRAQAAIEKASGYDAETNPSPTISAEQARLVSRIIAANPTCFDADLVEQAKAALTRTAPVTGPSGSTSP